MKSLERYGMVGLILMAQEDNQDAKLVSHNIKKIAKLQIQQEDYIN